MKKIRKRNLMVIGGIILIVVLNVLLIVLLVGPRQTERLVNVQYIRTDGYVEGAWYPKVSLIRSVSELEAYYEANKDNYYLGRNENVHADGTIGFLDACDKYDESFFSTQSLVLVLLEEGSGSIRHNVTKVESVEVSGEEQLQIHIDRKIPQIGTDDMAEWHLFIELPAGIEVSDEEQVTVLIDGVDRTKRVGKIECKRGYANMCLTKFKGWEFEVVEGAEGETPVIGISFWPEGESGKLSLEYWGNQWGVCGTGLKGEKIELGRYDAWKGSYDDNPVWEFIHFEGTPGTYVVRNLGASSWWDEYGSEAMEILDTVRLADTIFSEKQAISMAVQKSGKSEEDYRQIIAEFDHESGNWTVKMYTDSDTWITATVDNGGSIDLPEK